MRAVAGSILVLAAAVLFAAYWLGRVAHNSTVVGSPEAMYLPTAAAVLAVFGGAFVIGLIPVQNHSDEDDPRA
jgi:hypothetical protein